MPARQEQGLPEGFPATVSADQMGAIIGLSARNVQGAAARGIIIRSKAERGRYDLAASLRAYTHHLREMAAGRAGGTDGKTLAASRASLTDLQAEEAKLRLARARGEVISVDEARDGWSNIARLVKAGVLALPSKMRFAIPHLTAHDGETMRTIARESLEDIARDIQGSGAPGVDRSAPLEPASGKTKTKGRPRGR